MRLYQLRPWGMQCLIPHTVLMVLATKARLQTCNELINIAGWSPTHVQKHGTEIIDLLKAYDEKFKAAKDAEIKARATQKKLETMARQQEKREAAKAERARWCAQL
jgi:hypothetical protein